MSVKPSRRDAKVESLPDAFAQSVMKPRGSSTEVILRCAFTSLDTLSYNYDLVLFHLTMRKDILTFLFVLGFFSMDS